MLNLLQQSLNIMAAGRACSPSEKLLLKRKKMQSEDFLLPNFESVSLTVGYLSYVIVPYRLGYEGFTSSRPSNATLLFSDPNVESRNEK